MRRITSVLLILILLLALLFANCGQQCNVLNRLVDPECRALSNILPKKKIFSTKAPPSGGACGGTSLKYNIQCPVSSNGPNSTPANPADGTATNCAASSNSSGYLILVLPDTNGGTYTAPSNGQFAGDCDTAYGLLYNPDPTIALQASDVAGIVVVAAGAQGVSCNNVAGCQNPAGGPFCFATWDPSAQSPTSTAATFGAASNYLFCAYIDSPPGGGPFSGISPTQVPLMVPSGPPHPFTPLPGLAGAGTAGLNNWGDF